jgi:hypothetical protein
MLRIVMSSIIRCLSGDTGLLIGKLPSCALHMQRRRSYR